MSLTSWKMRIAAGQEGFVDALPVGFVAGTGTPAFFKVSVHIHGNESGGSIQRAATAEEAVRQHLAEAGLKAEIFNPLTV